jgi:RimJ/RimL family protein N-acetyltransferase
VAWFRRPDNDRVHYMAFTDDGSPFGEIRFDRDPSDPSRATVSLNVAPSSRGKGLGTELIRQATGRYLPSLGPEGRVEASVKETNVASLRAFRTAGYTDVRSAHGEVVLMASAAAPGSHNA